MFRRRAIVVGASAAIVLTAAASTIAAAHSGHENALSGSETAASQSAGDEWQGNWLPPAAVLGVAEQDGGDRNQRSAAEEGRIAASWLPPESQAVAGPLRGPQRPWLFVPAGARRNRDLP